MHAKSFSTFFDKPPLEENLEPINIVKFILYNNINELLKCVFIHFMINFV